MTGTSSEAVTTATPCCSASTWALALGAVAAVGTAVFVATLLGRKHQQRGKDRVPQLIANCFERLQDIEADLSRMGAV